MLGLVGLTMRLFGAEPASVTTSVPGVIAEPSTAFAPNGAAVAPTPDPVVSLAEAVQREIGTSSGRFGIAIKDLSTGQTLLMNDRMSFSAASLFKLPVMYEVFRQRQLGNISFESELVVSEGMVQYDLGTLAWPVGTRITVGTALERMITASDNVSAVMLLSLIGANQINQEMAELGLESTSIGGSRLTTSARDMMLLMEMITTGKAIDEKSSAEMLHLMRRQLVRNRIPLLLPPDTPVGNKTGNWEDSAHDVGFVYSPKSTFAIAVLTQGAGDAESAHGLIARITRLTYDQFNRPEFSGTPLRMPLETMPTYASAPRVPTNARPPTSNGPGVTAAQPGIPAAVAQQQVSQPVRQPTAAARSSTGSQPAAPTAAPAAPAASTAPAVQPTARPNPPQPAVQAQPTPMPTPLGYDIVQRRVREAQQNASQPTAVPQPTQQRAAPQPTAQPTPKRS